MRELRIYKPTKTKQGTAASFQLTVKGEYKEPMVFLTLARQGADDDKGNNSFGWKDEANRVVVKLTELDAAKILLVLFGMAGGLGEKISEGKYKGLYHDPSKSGTAESNQGMSKVVQFTKLDNGGYSLGISAKQGDDRNALQVSVDQAEAILIKTFLNGFIEKYYLGD